jgi:hypothetical protein
MENGDEVHLQSFLKSKRRFRLKLAVGALLLVVLVGELVLFVVNLHTRRRAESLIAELRMLRVDVSTLQDAQPILTRYKAINVAWSPESQLVRSVP